MENDGERFIPEFCNAYDLTINIQRYLYAMKKCVGKVVLDCGCGAGLGTYLYSLVAKKVIAVDRNDGALEYAKRFNFNNKIEFIQKDLDKDELPDADIAVALEVIEHLQDPDGFLQRLKPKELVWSIPMESKRISKWHTQDYRDLEDIVRQIKKFHTTEETYAQEKLWIYGYSLKKQN